MRKGRINLLALLLVTTIAASVFLTIGCTSLNINGNTNKPGYNPNNGGNGGSYENPIDDDNNDDSECNLMIVFQQIKVMKFMMKILI